MEETTNKHSYHVVFTEGPIEASAIAGALSGEPCDDATGAYNIFLGQVRRDIKNGKTISGIEYLCFKEMAAKVLDTICTKAITRFNLRHVNIIHSLGLVRPGEICLLVLVSGGHRKECFEACREIVEQIKKEVPIWGKELFEDASHSWKVNKF